MTVWQTNKLSIILVTLYNKLAKDTVQFRNAGFTAKLTRNFNYNNFIQTDGNLRQLAAELLAFTCNLTYNLNVVYM